MRLLLSLLVVSALAAQDVDFDNLAARMENRDPKIRREGAKLLGESGDKRAIPVLGKAVKDLDTETRYQSVQALGSFLDRETIPFLAEAMKDPERRVKQSAIDGMVTQYISVKGPGGIKGVFTKTVDVFRKGGDDAIVAPGTDVDTRVIASLADAVSDPDNEVAKDSARALGVLRGSAAVPAMGKVLYGAPNPVKVEILRAFQKIRDPKAAPEVVHVLANSNKDVRAQAALTLGLLGARDQRTRLRSLFDSDPDKGVRLRAFEALSMMPDAADAAWFAGYLEDKDDKMRELAADAFGRMPQAAVTKEYDEKLSGRLGVEKNGRVKLALAFALTAQGHGDRLPDLVDSLDSMLHRQYGIAYLTELGRDASRLPSYYPYLKGDRADIRRYLCDVFTNLANPAALEQVRPLTQDPNDQVVTAAIRAVQTMERVK